MKKNILIILTMLHVSIFSQASILNLTFNGLEDLGANARYEGWLIVNGSPVSTGVFTVDSAGVPSVSSVTVSESNRANAVAFVLTIEPFPDNNPAPAATHILAGSITNDSANLSVNHPAAIGDDLTAATGTFILAAPSDTGALGSYKNGIWYLTPPNPDPSLNLPTLPAGWTYEGWVVDTVAGTPISTGKFMSVNGADSDGGGAAVGPGPTPPFPGQDFINPLRDLSTGHLAVISVEPVPDNSPNPFTLKPLVASISDPGVGGISQALSNNANATNPTGNINFVFAAPASVPSLGLVSVIFLLLTLVLITKKYMTKSSSIASNLK